MSFVDNPDFLNKRKKYNDDLQELRKKQIELIRQGISSYDNNSLTAQETIITIESIVCNTEDEASDLFGEFMDWCKQNE